MDLIFPEGMYFDCRSCARCCRGWTVHLDAHALRDVKDSPLYQRLEREDGVSPFDSEDPEQGESAACTRMKDGHCVFLGDDDLCMIHKELGAAAKPLGCTLFPFLLRPTPDGVYVGVSFFCSSVQENTGRPLGEHRGDLQRALGDHHFPSIADVVALDRSCDISWRLYRRIEESSVRTLRDASDLADGLWQAALHILLLSSALRTGSVDAERTWDRIAARRVERDEIFGFLASAHLAGLTGLIAPAETGGVVDLEHFDDYRTRFDATWSLVHFRRFVEHLVFRKFLVYRRSLVAGAAAWSLTLPALEWYRDLFAFAAHRSEPVLEDVWRALDVVERGFTLHALHLDEFFQELAAGFGKMLDVMPDLLAGGTP